MYLRTTRRKNADGSVVEYYQLAENTWDAAKGCAVAKVVYNFGRADQLDRAALQRLAKSILRVSPGEEAIRSEAGVRLRNAWPYGAIHVVDAIWRELGIDKVIADLTRRHGTRQPFERALFAMVANRTHEPYSKSYCREQWLGEGVFFPGEEALEVEHLDRAMDFLEAHKEQVEKEIFFRTADLMKADVDLIFYDTTSLHFEVDEEDQVLRRRNELAGGREYPSLRKSGHSRTGQGDAPQIVVGLAVTRDGLPVRSWVFPGHTTDVSTVDKVKEEEAERLASRRQQVLAELRRELATLRKPKRRENHSKRACQLPSTPRFARYPRQTRRGALEIDRAAVHEEEELDGTWVVTSNDDALSAEDLALGYQQLMRVESCWRSIESCLRTRPVFHCKPDRISAHVSLCVLALLIERIVEIRTGQTWGNVRATLDTVKVVEYERGNAVVRQTTELRGEVEALLRILRIAAPQRLHSVATAPAA